MEKKLQTTKGLIAITGPESTGKTTLSIKLSKYFDCTLLSEYAREYLNKTEGVYSEKDVLHIAEMQLERENIAMNENDGLIICDGDLLVCKIWMEVAWNRSPKWIDKELASKRYTGHLLLKPDIPWTYDPLREHPNEREAIYERYLKTLNSFNCPYTIISGINKERFEKSVNAIKMFL